MNFPVCHHEVPTKAKLNGDAPAGAGWIFCCRDCYESAVRSNLITYADQTLPLKLEKELISARERVQQLESDIQDVRMISKQAFVRCAACHRLQEVSKPCRWCTR